MPNSERTAYSAARLQGVHRDFHAEATQMLESLAKRYGCSLHGVGISPQAHDVIIVARFSAPEQLHQGTTSC